MTIAPHIPDQKCVKRKARRADTAELTPAEDESSTRKKKRRDGGKGDDGGEVSVRKKKKDGEEKQSESQAMNTEEVSLMAPITKKKRKAKDLSDASTASKPMVIDTVPTPIKDTETSDGRKKRKRKPSTVDAPEETRPVELADQVIPPIEVPTPPVHLTKKRKRFHAIPDAVDLNDDDAVVPEDPSSPPKTKRKKSKSTTTETSETISPPSQKPPKKPRKNKTPYPDPDEDEDLPNQARKALSYAFLQARRPTKWKFNKAKQNWLVRHVWSGSAVPEPHLPLVTSYISKIQGGTRENLIKSCHLILQPPPPPATPKETDTPAENTKPTSESTAPPLRGILKKSNAAPTPAMEEGQDSNSQTVVPPKGKEEDDALNKTREEEARVRKERAQLILDVLSDTT